MIFAETKLQGAFVLDLERREDNHGFFARSFCQREFEQHGLKPGVAQVNMGFSKKKGTLRGMHFQFPPAGETTLVRCTRGHRALYVPERFAHGYQVLEDETEASYQAGEFYTPAAESGLRASDPRLGLVWPLPITDSSPKDAAWGLLAEVEPELRRRMTP